MMAEKARLFGDTESAEKIVAAKGASKAKKAGPPGTNLGTAERFSYNKQDEVVGKTPGPASYNAD